jgi:hypothetical protein
MTTCARANRRGQVLVEIRKYSARNMFCQEQLAPSLRSHQVEAAINNTQILIIVDLVKLTRTN